MPPLLGDIKNQYKSNHAASFGDTRRSVDDTRLIQVIIALGSFSATFKDGNIPMRKRSGMLGIILVPTKRFLGVLRRDPFGAWSSKGLDQAIVDAILMPVRASIVIYKVEFYIHGVGFRYLPKDLDKIGNLVDEIFGFVISQGSTGLGAELPTRAETRRQLLPDVVTGYSALESRQA